MNIQVRRRQRHTGIYLVLLLISLCFPDAFARAADKTESTAVKKTTKASIKKDDKSAKKNKAAVSKAGDKKAAGSKKVLSAPRIIKPAMGVRSLSPALAARKKAEKKDESKEEEEKKNEKDKEKESPAKTQKTTTRKPSPVRKSSNTNVDSSDASPTDDGEITIQELRSGIDFRKKPGNYTFTFNLQDATLEDLIRIMGNITGRRFIVGSKLRKIQATIYAPTKVTAWEAYKAFLSVLEVNGLTLVPSGKYYKIVESKSAIQRTIPIYDSDSMVPEEDRIVTRIHKLKEVSAEEISQLLDRFKSGEGDITVYAPTNTLIISDYGSNIKRLVRLADEFDVAGTGEQIYVEPIHYADAEELASRLLEIFEAESVTGKKKRPAATSRKRTKTAGGTATVGQETGETKLSKIIADTRTNVLLIMASERTYLRILELIRHLDVPVPGEGEIHVHPLQHADAQELSQTLSSLASGSTARKGKSKTQGGVDLFEGEVKISADKATNSLVVVSSLRDYVHLKSVVNQLDVTRRQVFVEAVIMEVSLDKQRKFGLAFHAGTTFDTDEGSAVGFGGTQMGGINSVIIDPTAMMGLAAGVRGPEIEGTEGLLGPGVSIPAFGVALQALQDNNDVNVLSTPHVLATDNIASELSVGGNVPMQQGFAQGLGNMLGAAAAQAGGGMGGNMGNIGGMLNPMVSVGRQNVGLNLKLTPHINEDDEVRLEIDIDISEVSGESNLGPILSKKTAKTTSIVQDQQTVVLGGLITDNQTETIEKVPVLGDIPIIGYLFKHTKTRLSKRNLLIFLTPYIIRDPSDFRRIFNRKMAERREFIERYTAFASTRVDPDLDYNRTNGLLEEINKTLLEIEEEERLRKESEAQPPPEHLPSEPITFPPGTILRGSGDGDYDDADFADEPADAPEASNSGASGSVPIE